MDTRFKLSDLSRDGEMVYFDVDVAELFDSPISADIQTALIYAFNQTKTSNVIPKDTGMTQRSFTLKIDGRKNVARLYFDPKKIVGQKRNGYIVKDYYPRYLVEYPQHNSWLDDTIKVFFTYLKERIGTINKRNAKKNETRDKKNLIPLVSILALDNVLSKVNKDIRKRNEKANKAKSERLKRIKELENKQRKVRSNYEQ